MEVRFVANRSVGKGERESDKNYEWHDKERHISTEKWQ